MIDHLDRRKWLQFTSGLVLGGIAPTPSAAQTKPKLPDGCSIVGHPLAAKAGGDVLASGGNAVDAIVTAALVACVTAVHQCGIGGYGGHMVIALPRGTKITAIDFNTAAPAAAKPDLFPLDEKGQVKGRVNTHGWLSAGVPGTLAGLELALTRYGTRSLDRVLRPAIALARDGFEVTASLSTAIRAQRATILKDTATANLLLTKGEPLKPGATYRNAELADLLQTLANRKSVQPFYRGDIARKIAAAFEKNEGLVTADDLAAYQAREVRPYSLDWGDYTLYTAPLTAGGLTVLQAIHVLKVLGWEKRAPRDPATTLAKLEALRLAWDDRLKHLGDPAKTKVDIEHLLSPAHARKLAARVEQAVKDRKPSDAKGDGRKADGTIHLSASDSKGMMVALTLTHGSHFGANVTVPELGLILGHGMSRFDPRPDHPNSPGPGKRPLHNMCPTIVTRNHQATLAVGGTGGRRIPNAIFEVLTQFVGRNASLEDALAAPRVHTEGDLEVILEPAWPKEEVESLKKIGYTARTGPNATVHAVFVDPKTGLSRVGSR